MFRKIFATGAVLLISGALSACNGSNGNLLPTVAPSAATATPAISIVPQITAQPTTDFSQFPTTVPGTPAPTPDIEKVINPQPDDWTRGAVSPTVTFIEWSDFQCPYCSQFAPVLEKLLKAYPNDVRVVYRHFPLISIHDKALLAAEATEAAGAQGKFWEMHDVIFSNHDIWENAAPADFRKTLDTYATQIGLDVKQFGTDLDGGKYEKKVMDAYNLAAQLGLSGTPFILVNQNPWPNDLNYLSYNNVVGIVKLFAELPQKQFKQAPVMALDAKKSFVATLKTDQGDIVIKLYADITPIAVNN
ncbi:MAG TPA: thioredoxin domain-containing protein, partial [Anaerolineae bacterium]|nr:thioredoxin domain-containing protein [Anaerolineae bacterium]